MNALKLSSIALALTILSASAEAALVNCKPAKDCSAAGKPCNKYISKGATVTVSTNNLPQDSVIRVRVCTKSDSVCKDGADVQAVSVFGYKGAASVYTKHLNQNSGYDTGGYTKVAGLTKLRIRCNSTLTAYCLVAWQHCLEPPRIKLRTR